MKLKRLRQMSKDEISYRIKEKVRREIDRAKFHLGIGVEQDREFSSLLKAQDSSFKTYLQRTVSHRFYAGTHDERRAGISAAMTDSFPDWRSRTIENADRLLNHEVDLLGFSAVDLGKDINWHTDPISGYCWHRGYCAKYNLINSSESDPKAIHELNRQQHLPRLAKAFFITGEEQYAREAVAQMESWIHQNRKWNGVNWESSLEIAIRSISWLWTLFLLLSSKALDESATRRISKALFAQLDQISRYPSVYSSPNTHLIGEAAAMFMAGILFSELPRAAKWRQDGAAILMEQMGRQVSSEGVYREASTYYHCYAADFYLQTMVLARVNRFTFPEWMWKRLSMMLEYASHLTRADGSIPLIGDDDGGRVLAIANRHYGTFRDGLSSGAVLFGRPDFKFMSGGFAEESLWTLGDDAVAVFDSLTAHAPAQTHRAYKEIGQIIQRTGWEQSDSHLTFDCGGLGMLTGGHGHADALSLTLFSGGRELLIDPATSVYNCAPAWRNFFRSTRGHNTVVVDDMDQSEPAGTFSWKTKSTTRVAQHITLPGIEYIDAEHDGYLRLQHPVIHRRRLVHINPGYWIVLDELRGSGRHKFEFFYHFAPETELFVLGNEGRGEVDCRARVQQSELQLFMYGSDVVQVEALCAQLEPLQGWSSQRYGERRPSPVLKATMREQAPAGMMTFLVPGLEPARTRKLQARGGQSIAAVVRNGAYEDIAVQSIDDAPLHLMDYSLHGEFFWIRTQNGALVQLMAVNAKSFRFGTEAVFESQEPIPYVTAYFWENGIVIERGEREGKTYVRDLRDRQFQSN